MHIRVLKDEESLKLYSEMAAAKVKVKLPLEYLKRGTVVAITPKDKSTIYGGFVIVSKGELRAIKQLPQEFLESRPDVQKKAKRCFEINGLWINRREVSCVDRFKMYSLCFLQIMKNFSLGKHYFVYAFDANNPKLEEFFSSFNSERIFHGEIPPIEGMEEPAHEKVEICSLPRLMRAALRNPEFITQRLPTSPLKIRAQEQ